MDDYFGNIVFYVVSFSMGTCLVAYLLFFLYIMREFILAIFEYALKAAFLGAICYGIARILYG